MQATRGRRLPLRAIVISAACIVLLSVAASVRTHVFTRDAGRDCPPCKLQLHSVASLGSLEDPVGRSMQSLLGRLSSGQFVLVPMFGAPQIALYDEDGRFISMYDRTGDGPGELNSSGQRLGIVDGNSIRLWTRGRLLTFDSELRPIRTARWNSTGGHIAVFPDGTMLANYTMSAPAGVLVTHVLSETGVIASLESQDATDPSAAHRRLYAAGADGTFWSARTNEPRVDQYTLDGRHLATLTPAMEWFSSWTVRSDRAPFMERPQHFNAGLRQLDDTHLLLLSRVPDANWQPQNEPVITPDSEQHSIYDTILTVVNRETGQVVSAVSSPRFLTFVEGTDDLVYATEAVPSGDIVLKVWRVTLN